MNNYLLLLVRAVSHMHTNTFNFFIKKIHLLAFHIH